MMSQQERRGKIFLIDIIVGLPEWLSNRDAQQNCLCSACCAIDVPIDALRIEGGWLLGTASINNVQHLQGPAYMIIACFEFLGQIFNS